MERDIWGIALGFLFLSGFAMGLVFPSDVYYPRPWENGTWLGENEYVNDEFGRVWFTSGGSSLGTEDKERLEGLLQREIPDFQESIEGLRLEELHVETKGDNARIEEAVRHLKWARRIKYELEDFLSFGLTQSLSVWDYPGHWMGCVNESLGALEDYSRELNATSETFVGIQRKFAHAGACDADYSGAMLESCTEPVVDVSCDYGGLWETFPEFGWYYPCVHRHIDALVLMREKVRLLNESFVSLGEECSDIAALSEKKKADADKFWKDIEAEELERIYRSSSAGDFPGAESVGESFLHLRELKKEADDSLLRGDDGVAGMENMETSWAKDCIMGHTAAMAGYSEILGSDILDAATDAVYEYRDEAYGLLREARGAEAELGSKGAANLEEAEAECRKGDTASSLGNRFAHYEKCIECSNIALSSAGGGERVEDAYVASEMGRIEDLLERAEADRLWVDAWRQLFDGIQISPAPEGYVDVLEEIENGIAAQAEAKYSFLPAKRERIVVLIEAGGPSFEKFGVGRVAEECYNGNALDYLCALGRLREMDKDYEDIERVLEEESAKLLRSGLIIDSHESMGPAVLDEEAPAYLYVNVHNPLGISSRESVDIEVQSAMEFRKIDIIEGGETVRQVSAGRGKVVVSLSNVSAGEDITIVFRRELVACSTKEYSSKAYGDSTGGAKVETTHKIECEYAVDALSLGEAGTGYETVKVDGIEVPAPGGKIKRALEKGKHEITTSTYEYSAYTVERNGSSARSSGQKVKIEFFLVFHPQRDLEYITYSTTEGGGGLPSRLDVFGYTGEKITDEKIMGENTIAFTIKGMKKGKEAMVRISYETSSIEEYVERQIGEFSGKNLSAEEEKLLEEARESAFSDNYNEAYEKVEQLRSLVEQREKAHASALKKHAKLRGQIQEKAGALEEALSLADSLGVDEPCVERMRARLGELESALGLEVAEDAVVGPLEGMDMGWEKKEIARVSKELLGLEEGIKEGWAENGQEDASVEEAISKMESANSLFMGTLDFSDAISSFKSAREAGALVADANGKKEESDGERRLLLEDALESASVVLEEYSTVYDDADGTSLERIFGATPQEITKEMKELRSSTEYEEAAARAGELEAQMAGTLDFIMEEEERLAGSLGELYAGRKDEMGEEDAAFVEMKMEGAKELASRGDYVNALLSLEEGVERAAEPEKEDGGVIMLALTGLLVLGIIALYAGRDHIPKDMLSRAGLKKEKKEYKPLRREIQ